MGPGAGFFLKAPDFEPELPFVLVTLTATVVLPPPVGFLHVGCRKISPVSFFDLITSPSIFLLQM